MSVLPYISFATFIAYILWICVAFGVPESISETYYILERRRKGRGLIFTIWCWIVALLLLPYWLEISSENTQFLAFFAALGLCFVGAAPRFRSYGMERTTHFIGAVMSGACSLMLLLWAGAGIYPLATLSAFAIPIFINRENWLFWLEMGAFTPVFLAAFINN